MPYPIAERLISRIRHGCRSREPHAHGLPSRTDGSRGHTVHGEPGGIDGDRPHPGRRRWIPRAVEATSHAAWEARLILCGSNTSLQNSTFWHLNDSIGCARFAKLFRAYFSMIRGSRGHDDDPDKSNARTRQIRPSSETSLAGRSPCVEDPLVQEEVDSEGDDRAPHGL